MTTLVVFLRSIGLICRGHRAVALENLALRQQLAALTRTTRRKQLRPLDRFFWILLAKSWRDWRSALIIVQPDTVIRWHRQWLRRRWARRRRIVHVTVTEHPTAEWTAQQIVEAFPENTAPTSLLRDRDAIYGDVYRRRVASLGITEVISSPSSPWQNPYVERLIGSVRRECPDHLIILSEPHLRHVLTRYVSYYHGSRTHLSLEKDAPTPRRIQDATEGHVVALAELGGLHHRYERCAA